MATEDQTAEQSPPSLGSVERVIATCRMQLGKPYRVGTEGPGLFDCSGLMWYAFHAVGLDALIGDGRHRARWYTNWFKTAGHFTTDMAKAKRGDLVVYGHPDAIVHMGIYLGPARHRAISALINPYGVTKHRVDGITVPVAGFCQVQY